MMENQKQIKQQSQDYLLVEKVVQTVALQCMREPILEAIEERKRKITSGIILKV